MNPWRTKKNNVESLKECNNVEDLGSLNLYSDPISLKEINPAAVYV